MDAQVKILLFVANAIAKSAIPIKRKMGDALRNHENNGEFICKQQAQHKQRWQ